MLVSLILWMDWNSSFTLLFLITTLWLGMVGGYDDYLKLKFKNSKGLSAKKKFLFQNLCALVVALYLFFLKSLMYSVRDLGCIRRLLKWCRIQVES